MKIGIGDDDTEKSDADEEKEDPGYFHAKELKFVVPLSFIIRPV